VLSFVFSTVAVIGVVANRIGETFVALGIVLVVAGLSARVTPVMLKFPEFLVMSIADSMGVKDDYRILPSLVPRTLLLTGISLFIFGAIQVL
jgi:hypothetical protein